MSAGDVVLLDPFEQHKLKNTGEDDLQFLTIYWRNRSIAADAAAARRNADLLRSRCGPVIVTSTPPTPNGDLHLGHLSGPYLGADAHTRFLRMNGIEAYHLTGSDDYQSYAVAKARAACEDIETTVAHFANAIEGTLSAFGISVDQFTRSSTTPGYADAVKEFVAVLERSGVVRPATTEAMFDSRTGAYLYEVDVSGDCPNCGSRTNGNICEECGHPNLCVDLHAPRSNLSDSEPVVKPLSRLCIDLKEVADGVRAHHEQSRMAPRLRCLIDQILDRGVESVAVTQPADWGIRPPDPLLSDQVVWAWLEMVVGFLVGTRILAARVGFDVTSSGAPKDGRFVHFFGYDNAFYHTVLFPAALQGFHPEWDTPIDYVMNEFLLLDGKKFSTSRQHAIWGRDITSVLSVDEARFVLAWNRPETTRTNFTIANAKRVAREELRENWASWLAHLQRLVDEDFDSLVPDAGSWTPEQVDFSDFLREAITRAARGYRSESFSLQRVSRVMSDLVRESVRFGAAESHWRATRTRRSTWRTSVSLQLAAARTLAQIAWPLMPAMAGRLYAGLGTTVGDVAPEWSPYPVPPTPGTRLAIDADGLFEDPAATKHDQPSSMGNAE